MRNSLIGHSYCKITIYSLLRHFHVDPPLVFQVDLVPRDRQVDVRAEHLSQLLHPVLHLLKAVGVRHVVDEDGAVRVAVVDRPERVEALLAGGVPDGQVAPVAADVQLLVQERGLLIKVSHVQLNTMPKQF